MKVDKENGNVKYNDEHHLYFDDDGNKYISVTTLIHRYQQPFDKDFWISYKVIEKIDPILFKSCKSKLIESKKISTDILNKLDKERFNAEKIILESEWEAKNKESCERGTKIHNDLEQKFYDSTQDLSHLGLTGEYLTYKDTYDLSVDKGVFPEYLVSLNCGKFNIAGQIDLLIKDGNDIIICDYKTNKEIVTKSYFDKRLKKNISMKFPLNGLMDCNYIHYTLQLSLYAYMISQLNPKFNIKLLKLIHFDHCGNTKEYVLTYEKASIIKMIKDYDLACIMERLKKKSSINYGSTTEQD